MHMRPWAFAISFLALAACSVPQISEDTDTDDQPVALILEPVTYAELPGWSADDFQDVSTAFSRSCKRLQPQPPDRSMGALAEAGSIGDWIQLCDEIDLLTAPAEVKAAFERLLTPMRVRVTTGETSGLFTGYFEAQLDGSRTPSARYATPLYRLPADLVSVSLGDFSDALSGKRIAGKVAGGKLVPYDTRAEIVSGSLKDRAEPLVWVDDPVDAFMLQVQGSGRVALAEGGEMRVGYAGANGRAYYAIGRELVKRGEIPLEEISLQSIRAWAKANPQQTPEVLNTNASYVFFRALTGPGPIGAQGAPLTPGRSLAVDRRFLPLGVPVWVDLDHPESPGGTLRRMVIAQDVGGAIKGPIRGDFFWGHGPQAEALAGTMKASGTYYILIPKQKSDTISMAPLSALSDRSSVHRRPIARHPGWTIGSRSGRYR